MNTAPPTSNPSDSHTPLTPNEQGILVSTPPPLNEDSVTRLDLISNKPSLQKLLTLIGGIQLLLAITYGLIGLPYAEQIHATLRMTPDQTTPRWLIMATITVAIILLTYAFLGGRIGFGRFYAAYKNIGWMLLSGAVLLLSIFVAYIVRTVIIPMTYM